MPPFFTLLLSSPLSKHLLERRRRRRLGRVLATGLIYLMPFAQVRWAKLRGAGKFRRKGPRRKVAGKLPKSWEVSPLSPAQRDVAAVKALQRIQSVPTDKTPEEEAAPKRAKPSLMVAGWRQAAGGRAKRVQPLLPSSCSPAQSNSGPSMGTGEVTGSRSVSFNGCVQKELSEERPAPCEAPSNVAGPEPDTPVETIAPQNPDNGTATKLTNIEGGASNTGGSAADCFSFSAAGASCDVNDARVVGGLRSRHYRVAGIE